MSIKNILITPLDWGLGHTMRMVPIISILIQQQHQVTVAVNDLGATLLKEKFPSINIITNIPNYNIKYGKSKWHTVWLLILQTFKIKKAIHQEHIWLKNICTTHHFDYIISDNRYGCYHPNIPSIIVTHQLSPIVPFSFLFKRFIQKQIANYINRFNTCWMYDHQLPNALAGTLSVSNKIKIPLQYIGVHTRLLQLNEIKKYDAVIILSGPQPQLQILFDKICNQAKNYKGKLAIVAGNAQSKNPAAQQNIDFFNYANDSTISKLVAKSYFVICRSGYTSIMDYFLLKAKCIFIPTPGQTEQSYLATYLQAKNYALAFKQADFNLENAIAQAKTYSYHNYNYPLINLEKLIIENLI